MCSSDLWKPSMVLNALFKAIPVTMPGKAIGKIIIRLTAFLPKNLYRESAKANNVPKTRAITVEAAATVRLVIKASIKPVDWVAFCHQSRVKLGGGHFMLMFELKELISTIASGR